MTSWNHRKNTMTDYPPRPSHFAHKLVRLMIRACAAQEIGTDGFLLVTVIVHTEDAKRYTAPVTYWNEQLMSVLGFRSWGQLDRARKKATEGGWLHYERAANRTVGKYWATLPADLADLPNGPVDCDAHVLLATSGEETVKQTGNKRETNVKQTGMKREPSSLRPKPKAKPSPSASNGASIPEILDTPPFRTAWGEFKQHRKEGKKPMTPLAEKKMLNKAAKMGVATAIQAMDTSIRSGWTDIYEPKGRHGDAPPQPGPWMFKRATQPPEGGEA